MIVEVEPGGFIDATDAFLAGNHALAETHRRLVGGLARSAAMAGDDASGAEFAAAYDGAAADAVAALGDAVAAYATLARLTHRTLLNHAGADARAVLPGGVVADCAPVPEGRAVTALPATLPSSLGGDPPLLSPPEAWILDHVEGFVWPDADVSRLRGASATWRAAAQGIDDAASRAGAATAALLTQRSAEIPLAVDAADELRSTLREVAASCADLAAQCEAYAAEIEARHAEIRALLQEILRFVVEGFVVGAVLGGLTAGAGAAVGLGSIVARVAAQSPRFAAVLAALRTTTSGIASSLRGTRATLASQRARLERYLRVPARNERGHLTLAGGSRWEPGWLALHEHSGSHTLREHVGKTYDELVERVHDGSVPRASSFPDQAAAERILKEAIQKKSDDVQGWLASDRSQVVLDHWTGRPTGVSVTAETREVVTGVRLVLRRDPEMTEGFRIHTAFPQP